MKILQLALCVSILVCSSSLFAADSWPDFRGPALNGIADVDKVPTVWSEGENIAWKTALPGRAWSSPVVMDDKIWVTTASEDGKKLGALSVDLKSGSILQKIHLFDIASPARWAHAGDMQSYGSPSPVIEKGRVYVTFGNEGTAAIDTASGKVLWKREDIHADHMEGAGSSPVIYKHLLILTMDGGDVQFVTALNKESGKTVWKTPRTLDFGGIIKDRRKAFCTPIFKSGKSGTEMIIPAAGAVYGLKPETGKELWRADYNNKGFSVGSRPVLAGNMLLMSTGYISADMLGIKLGGHGNITEDIIWRDHRGVPKISSPIVVDDQVYMVDENGFITCRQPSDGKILWKSRLGNKFSASPVLAGGHLYFFDQTGKAHVIKPGKKLDVISTNELDSGCMASPAFVDNSLIVRTKTHLYRIGK